VAIILGSVIAHPLLVRRRSRASDHADVLAAAECKGVAD
jgi:hypothetical protein